MPLVLIAMNTIVALLPDFVTRVGGDENFALLIAHATRVAGDVIRFPHVGGTGGWRGTAERNVFT